MADVWLITGIPGAGKSTTARLLAQRLGRGVHIEGDELQGWIVSGGVLPDGRPREEASRQIELNVRNQCLLARSFVEADFTPVIDYVITNYHLTLYRSLLDGLSIRYVVLEPGIEVAIERDRARAKSVEYAQGHGAGIAETFAFLAEHFEPLRDHGLWLDTRSMTAEAAVRRILEREDDALLAL